MKVLLYADFRTSHARGWLDGLVSAGIEVCPVSSQVTGEGMDISVRGDVIALLRAAIVRKGINVRVRSWVDRYLEPPSTGPIRGIDALQVLDTTLAFARRSWQSRVLEKHARAFRPDIVHALRLPYEGVTALTARLAVPTVVSSWGQDFIRQTAGDPLLRAWVRTALPSAAGLHVDAKPDVKRALNHGLAPGCPTFHAAGNFGVDKRLFYPEATASSQYTIVYPRGRRSYVDHRAFLAMADALSNDERFRFVGVGLRGDPESEASAALLGNTLHLTDELPRADFAALLRTAAVVVSPAISDGTPNSVLEALACGAYVMAGDIEGLDEILTPNVYGKLLDTDNHVHWAAALLDATEAGDLERAKSVNPRHLPSAHDRNCNASRVRDFYARVAEGKLIRSVR